MGRVWPVATGMLWLMVSACSGSSDDSEVPRAGSGGSSGSAGSASAGSPVAGGAPGSAGTPGVAGASGGSASAGGAGAGGAVSTGGVSGAGDMTASGGVGVAGKGGAPAGGAGGNAAGASGKGGAGGMSGASGSGGRSDGGAGGGGGSGYNPCPTTGGKACTILPLGDSITEGCCTQTIGGYRIELFRQAVRNGKNITFVGLQTNGPTMVENRNFPRNHQGHGGFTISGISAQDVTDRALSMYHPNIVLLMIGTNDINGGLDVPNAPKRLGSLIDKITSSEPAALVVVASIIPIRNDNTNQRVITYNAAIKTEVNMRASSGKHVMWVDNYAVIAQNPNFKTALMTDDLHPNDTGYAALGQSFYSAISALLPIAVQ